MRSSKLIGRSVAALLVAFSLIQCARAAETERPNILLILVDDMGWKDLGCYGSDFYKTPHIDKLASEGMLFTDGYAAASVCSPTRASIVTGKYPARTRLTDWIPGSKHPKKPLRMPKWQRWLPEEEVTIGELFQQNGYRTAWLGKWHLRGLPTPEHPDPALQDPLYATPQQEHGFDVGVQDWYLNSDERPEDPKGVFELTNETIEFIKNTPDQPWFVTLSHYSVHSPVRFNDEVRDAYKAAVNPNALQQNAAYAAMVEPLDQSIGKLMAFMKEQSLDENTLIVFISDNGGVSGWTNNAPLRNGKGTLYEGGTRVPWIARWPGRIPAGVTSDAVVSSIDLYPTFARVAGIPNLPTDIDGVDLSDHLLSSKPLGRDAVYWHYPHYHHGVPSGSIRKDDYKLIEYFEDGKLELFNLKADLSEKKNLVDQKPELAEELHQALVDWRDKVDAQMPTPNPNYSSRSK
ncbi:Arylsulfatase [Rubripirellula obstinata]|uniref:Arylsulfatase n=1 Tax=Rubripirellula obstinata TaxID=406547 RepID=A0A5B1CMU6_9BACT|nr:sulfatase [Rubripirellula obstinata]KAA1261235.1 Arylsulfatase [Rubripirellula obstinata]